MSSNKVDLLNTILIVLSLALAFYFPFALFLMAYAILGPLHYLTEINWIRDKNYFVKNKQWVYIIICFSLIISLPTIFRLSWFDSVSNPIINFIQFTLGQYTNSLIFLSLILAFVFLYVTKLKYRIAIIISAIVFYLLVNKFSAYNVLVGVFLPTIIHVYLFTLLFMWYGSLKSKATVGYFNVFLLALVPLIVFFINIKGSSYNIDFGIKEIILENRFFLLNKYMSQALGLSDGSDFYFNNIIDIKIQIVIAFAYTYHYLNWFSKTSVIGWHKKITTKKSIVILGLWLISLALYFYDYKIGLALLLMMSFAHVFLEFPLNIISVRGIFDHYYKSVK